MRMNSVDNPPTEPRTELLRYVPNSPVIYEKWLRALYAKAGKNFGIYATIKKKPWWVSSFFSLAAGGQAILRQHRIFVVEIILIIELKIIWTRSLFFYFSIP